MKEQKSSLYQKLADARKHIRESKVTKDGNGGNFKYFTPETIATLVSDACESVKMLPLTSLKRDEHGLYQELKLVDLESDSEPLVFSLATEKGEVRNTNASQHMGSTDTYSERYILMKAFQIKDNNLDPDAHVGKSKVQNEADKLGF